MPAGKQSQSSAMLYTLIAFVSISIIATVCAVYFYVKAEDYKTQHSAAQVALLKFATDTEQAQIARIVGRPLQGKSSIGTMSSLLHELVAAITGTAVEDSPATVKANDAKVRINETVEMLAAADLISRTQGVNLLQTIQHLKGQLDSLNASQAMLAQRHLKLQEDFDAAQEESRSTEQRLIADKDSFQALAEDVQAKHDELRRMMDKSAEDQVRLCMDRLEKEQARLKERGQELLATQDKLKYTQKSLDLALQKLDAIKGPGVDIGLAAYKADARIVRIDEQAKVVYLDIGSRDRVYRGLTFSVYDRNADIPEDGKGKAEIEVFQVSENVSAAKINYSTIKNPVTSQDIVANLIWDSQISNRFVVVGDFDFNADGFIDDDGRDRIVQLIQRWGGRVVKEVSIETDFVVLGTKPSARPRPSAEEIQMDPTVEQKYEASLQMVLAYDDAFSRAANLSVPVINHERFMHMIGYRTLADKSMPF